MNGGDTDILMCNEILSQHSKNKLVTPLIIIMIRGRSWASSQHGSGVAK